MRKEVVWAIIAGVILGLVIAFGAFRINSTPNSSKKVVVNSPSPTPTPNSPSEFKIVLDKPQENDVVTQNSVTVSGLTKGTAWINISAENKDYIVQSANSGAFTKDIDLIPGINQIKVTAFDASGNPNATQVLVVYSASFQLHDAATSTTSPSASESSVIRQKVANDLANTLSRPKAYIGTVTDVTDSNIEIKTGVSDIKQVSIGATTTNVVNSVGTNNKQAKPSDIAIGDTIVAMGYIATNSVLDAQRILITDPVIEPKIIVSEAKVTEISKKSLSISSVDGNTEDTISPDSKTIFEIYKDGKTVTSKLSAIVKDSVLIYVTTTNDKNIASIRSIFVLPEN